MAAARWVCDPGKAERRAPAARQGWRVWARQDGGLLSTELRVLFEILPDLTGREFRPVKQVSVAKAIHVHQSGVSKTLGRLVHAGYLEAGPREWTREHLPAGPQALRGRMDPLPKPASGPWIVTQLLTRR